MVKKLIKYDFQSYFRLLLPVQLVLIGVALINRIVQLFEPASEVYGLRYGFLSFLLEGSTNAYRGFFSSSLTLYFISIAVCLLMTVIVAVIRFYQGMYTHEGYLNHTLPVTTTQHIFAKLLISVIFYLGSMLAVFLSFVVITFGDLNIEIFKAVGYLIRHWYSEIGAQLILYVLEGLILTLLSLATTYFMLYFCISVGQLVSKKKILLAFGVFFGLYVLGQIVSTVIIVTLTVNYEWFQGLFEWIGDHPQAATHIFLGGGILFNLIFSTIYFLITKYIMSKKLNLT